MDLLDTPKLFLCSSKFIAHLNAATHTSQMCVLQIQIHQNPDTLGSTCRFDLSVFAWESMSACVYVYSTTASKHVPAFPANMHVRSVILCKTHAHSAFIHEMM